MNFSESVVSNNCLSAKYTEAPWFSLLLPINPKSGVSEA